MNLSPGEGLHSGPPDRVCLECSHVFHLDPNWGYEQSRSCPSCGGHRLAKRYFCHGCNTWTSNRDPVLADEYGFLSLNPRCPYCNKVLLEALSDAAADSRNRSRRERNKKRREEEKCRKLKERG